MKIPSLFQYSIGFLLISILLCLCGCTALGLLIGNSIDKKNKKEVQISGWEINTIPENESVTLFLKNGNSITDEYRGTIPINDNEYYKDYESSYLVLNQNTILPILGETIELTLSNSTNSTIRLPFSGFDYNSVILKKGPSDLSSYLYKDIGTAKLKDDRLLDLKQIQDLVKSCDLPSRNYLLTRRAKINPCDVQYISYQEKGSSGTTIGMILGAGIDIALIAIISSMDIGISLPSDFGSSLSSSCPYVYSFDGSNYRLDSETFAGALFKAAQRTDTDILDHLKENNGHYKLRLTKELDETQYVDEFKLLVVDHPAGTQVMPSFDNKLHVLNALQSPESAIDKDGNNVINLIKSRDDHIWIGNPFTRNADIPGDGRDAMDVKFIRPANAEKVKLAFNVQNSQWAASIQKELLSLHGDKLEDWYHLMNTSETDRANYIKAMIREGMLLVQVWDGHEWKTRDFIWAVGPVIPKDQVVVIDLKDIPGDELRIRLESTVGFWIINFIGADFTNDEQVEVQELTAETAIDHTGKNVTELLRYNDAMYLVMPTTEDKVDITFKAIPKNENSTRTYLLKCSGYYNKHSYETGEPNLSLLHKLVTEPGAYGQFVLKKLNQELNSVGTQ